MLKCGSETGITNAPASSATEAARKALAGVPAFRPVAMQLLRIMRNEDAPFQQIIALLRTDAVITAQVLRLANSPLFASRYEIKNALQALSFLGLERLNSLLITTALRSLSAIVPARISTLCWRHNLATAIIGKWLGASTELSPDRCYIAGLVHDIGALAMLRVFPSYESALLEGAQQGAELLAAETALFGIDHAEAGRWLLSNWGCPIDLQNVAAYHEEPWSGPEPDRPLLSLVHAASRLADHLELSIFGSQREADMQEIADFLPEKAAALLLSRFPDLVEYVAIRVNEVELSLM